MGIHVPKLLLSLSEFPFFIDDILKGKRSFKNERLPYLFQM